MNIEFKDKDELSFNAGDIIAFKIDSQCNKTEETHYYLIGTYYKDEKEDGEDYADFYLTDIKTGAMAMVLIDPSFIKRKIYLNRQDITDFIKNYGGKLYTEDKTKLILKERDE